ncbi:MAG: hypothetical protein JWM66_772 [Solirubrobacterales bacterium]|jgi:hypothetical protein|nr:hypothetical protein [Solirubrobacterales bacterium]
MVPRPPVVFYVIAFAACALSIAGFLLSMQNDAPLLAAGAGVIAAVGWFVCAWLLRRPQ